MGGICSTDGAGRDAWGDLIDRDHLENLGADGSVILKNIFKK